MDIPHHLVEQVRAGKAILFLGAGAAFGASSPTAPKSPPSGKELGKLLSAKFLGEEIADKPLALIADYCIDASDLRTVQSYIADIFSSFRPSPTHKAVADFRWAGLITTNYDQIVERAYGDNPKRLQTPIPILRDIDRVDHELRGLDAIPFVKLHGCISLVQDINYPLILTIDQYVTHRARRENLFSRFAGYASQYSVVYVGYQIEDPDIRSILSDLNAADISRPRHYVVTPKPSPRDTKIWETKRITTLDGTFDELWKLFRRKFLLAFGAIARPHKDTR